VGGGWGAGGGGGGGGGGRSLTWEIPFAATELCVALASATSRLEHLTEIKRELLAEKLATTCA